MPTFNKPAKKPKLWRRIVIILVLLILRRSFTKNITINQKVVVMKGDTVSTLLKALSSRDRTRVKLYIKTHNVNVAKLEPGTYDFSGIYSKGSFVQTILAWPTNKYIRITVLEGRSIYDIDASLTKKWLINQWEYISFVTDPTIISKYQAKYGYFSTLPPSNVPTLKTLEGFLYPDTYNVDASANIIDQLVYLQLENFNTKVWKANQDFIVSQGTERYRDVILASIVEKEERNPDNKAAVAGIFLKRLQIGMSLDADITLCYGLKQPYETCTPAVIARNVSDKNNPYNTRAVRGVPPTPISNPTAESISAVLHPETTSYLYYLHDNQGIIHYASTLDQHNANKAAYLK